ncbi:GTPase ObgE [Blattabacterium cuenoti]|uniref:GTPase ObgE n=1 Tax=Blattabacterium cuenoti TaxID=1653831 RepID=UPI00163C3798|nr:GTPase ObgE [Blattabacterium cuenoti]
MTNHFIDLIKIFCKSGNGGIGSNHIKKGKKIKKCIADGGSGGKGGNIIILGTSHYRTFAHLRFQRHFIAESGYAGGKNNKTGLNGNDLYIKVPLGTIIKDKNQNILAEIIFNNEQTILLQGGLGGKGSKLLKKPTIISLLYGIQTVGTWLTFELKILADVGIIGFPNVGKSTLLSVITNAKPKIGNFSFTTTQPNLGVVKYRYESYIIADIPGIIQNSYKGKGLGYVFLKHIERNSILLFLLTSESKNFKIEYSILLNELNKFNPKLLNKKKLVVISKSDLITDNLIRQNIVNILKETIIFISSFTKEGILKLKHKLWKLLHDKN